MDRHRGHGIVTVLGGSRSLPTVGVLAGPWTIARTGFLEYVVVQQLSAVFLDSPRLKLQYSTHTDPPSRFHEGIGTDIFDDDR